MNIRTMQISDFDFAAACTAAEGWASETRETFEGFWIHDPEGCFIAEEKGRPLGLCIATPYEKAGFIGELIVTEDMRGRGIGQQLLEHAIAYLRSQYIESIYLDGVVEAISLYERLGFRKICRSLRFASKIPFRLNPHVRPMNVKDLATAAALDYLAFGDDREFFLNRCHSLHPELCKVLVRNEKITGFIMGRRGHDVIAVGPWVVREGVTESGDLLASLAAEARDTRLRIGVLETNTAAVTLLRNLELEESPNPPWRMVLGTLNDLGLSDQCYAIGSAAKG